MAFLFNPAYLHETNAVSMAPIHNIDRPSLGVYRNSPKIVKIINNFRHEHTHKIILKINIFLFQNTLTAHSYMFY